MDKGTKELLQTILEDCNILDVDFSNWDKYITIVAVADHLQSSFDKNRRPVFKLEFWEVKQISFTFRHHSENDILETIEHFHWPVSEFTLSGNNLIVLKFFEQTTVPITEITFSKVTIEEIPQNVLDTVTPDWFEFYNPCARRSVQEIYNRIIGKKHSD